MLIRSVTPVTTTLEVLAAAEVSAAAAENAEKSKRKLGCFPPAKNLTIQIAD
jgi:hypothetical protein